MGIEIKESFVPVSREWAIKAASNAKYHIYRQRMRELRKCAERNCANRRKYLFFGPKLPYTRQDVVQEMYDILHDDDFGHDAVLCRALGQCTLNIANAVLDATKISTSDNIFLTLDDAATLRRYMKDDEIDNNKQAESYPAQ